MIVHPMQRRTGKNQIKLPRKTNLARVHDAKLQVGKFAPRKSPSREFDHLRRGVNTDRRAARNGVRDFGGHFAIAAADVENVFVAAKIEFGHQFARPGVLHNGIRGVGSSIPRYCFGNTGGHDDES